MKWIATGLAAAAVLVLVAGAFVFALSTRPGKQGTPTIVTPNTPAAVTSPTVAPPPTAKLAPVSKQPARRVTKPSCRGGDPTGSDTPGCGSADDQAGDSDSGDSSGDNQAGDGKSGGA